MCPRVAKPTWTRAKAQEKKPIYRYPVWVVERGYDQFLPPLQATCLFALIFHGTSVQHTFAPIELRTGHGVMLKEDIDRKQAEDARTGDVVLPPLTKAVSTDTEKRRLQALFQFKGGKALPEELTLAPIDGHVPLGIIAHQPARRSIGPTTAQISHAQNPAHDMIMDV